MRFKIIDENTLSTVAPHIEDRFSISMDDLLSHNDTSLEDVSPGQILEVPLTVTFKPLPNGVMKENIEQVRRYADEVAQKQDADILLYNGEIWWDSAIGANLEDVCGRRSIRRRPQAILILVTNGGDPHAAYRIASCLQQRYEKYTLYIPGCCKSAGSLVAVGAHDIVMSSHGHLGPLDVQISKPDDLRDSGSGLDVIKALDFLRDQTYAMFRDTLINLNVDSANRITLKTATTVATSLTTGLFNPLYAQFEPTKLGEISRAVRIAKEYGKRLNERYRNTTDRALEQLIHGYPSHAFVIHQDEAKQLFARVREPNDDERHLVDALELLIPGVSRVPVKHDDPANPNPMRAILGFVSIPNLIKQGEPEAAESTPEEVEEKLGTGASPNGK